MRAVYSLFGSRDGLIVALGAHAYDLLRAAIEQLPETADPQADLVKAGLVFRRFAIEHPALFSIGIQRTLPSSELWPAIRAAASGAQRVLSRRLVRLQESDLLGQRTVRDATVQFHSLCEGLAAVELRNGPPQGRRPHLARSAHSAHSRIRHHTPAATADADHPKPATDQPARVLIAASICARWGVDLASGSEHPAMLVGMPCSGERSDGPGACRAGASLHIGTGELPLCRQLGTLDMTAARDRMQNVERAATNACDDL